MAFRVACVETVDPRPKSVMYAIDPHPADGPPLPRGEGKTFDDAIIHVSPEKATHFT